MPDGRTDRGEGEHGQGEVGGRMEVALWGGRWIRRSSGDPSPSRINVLKFSAFTRDGLKEAAGAALGARRRAGGGAGTVGPRGEPECSLGDGRIGGREEGWEERRKGRRKGRRKAKEGRSVLF